VELDPRTVAPQATLTIRDIGLYEWIESPINQVIFPLEPRRYSVRAAASSYHPEKPYWIVDVYEPTRLPVKFLPAPEPVTPGPPPPPPRITRGLEDLKKPGNLEVRSRDPLAAVEVADNVGNIIKAGQGSLSLPELSPGFYSARLRTPEGQLLEKLIEVSPGETEPCTVDAPPLPETGLLKQLTENVGFHIGSDNMLEVSEAVGPMANAQLSTILALAGGAVNEEETGHGYNLRQLGLKTFKESVGADAQSGLQILFGIEFGTRDHINQLLSEVKLRCWRQGQAVPETYNQPSGFTAEGLAEFAWAKQPGPYWLSIEMGEQEPVVFAVTILPQRLTMMVFYQDASGQVNIYQYLPPLKPEEPGDPRFSAARFPVLRRLELIERAYISGHLDQAYPNAKALLQAKWIEPMAGCLGGYIMLKLGKASELDMAVGNLTNHFGELSDSHVLKAEYEASQGREEAATALYHTALDRGLPMFNDGLMRLVDAVQRYHIEHPLGVLAQDVFVNRARGLLWSAYAPKDLEPGQPLRFDKAKTQTGFMDPQQLQQQIMDKVISDVMEIVRMWRAVQQPVEEQTILDSILDLAKKSLGEQGLPVDEERICQLVYQQLAQDERERKEYDEGRRWLRHLIERELRKKGTLNLRLPRSRPEMYQTNMYEGMLAETVTIHGANGDIINAYFARPLGAGPFPGMVVIHHTPGWDEWYREATRKFAHHGYLAISPNLYYREGHSTPEDVAAKVRAAGGVPDDQVMGDVEGALRYLKSLLYCTGKVGVFGTCSGGRHTVLAASRVKGFDAAIDCWGGRVVMAQSELNPKQPVAPIDYTKNLSCPLLGLFGIEDQAPSSAQVDQHEQELKKHGKTYEFYRYDNAGHGFFYYDRPTYRQEQAVDGWKKVWAFLEKALST
jgi:carboxymethylenebutenolidase